MGFDVHFTSDLVSVNDWMTWVPSGDVATREAANHPECQDALDKNTDNAVRPDHGGRVVEIDGEKRGEGLLFGGVDPVDPLNTDNETPGGTYRLCWARPLGVADPAAWEPSTAVGSQGYRLVNNVYLHVHHAPPSAPPPAAPPFESWWRGKLGEDEACYKL